jgi:hypothetical protein
VRVRARHDQPMDDWICNGKLMETIVTGPRKMWRIAHEELNNKKAAEVMAW